MLWGPLVTVHSYKIVSDFETRITNDASRGYNVFTGSRIPMSSAVDSGFRKQIFLFNITSREKFLVEGFQVFPQTICDAQFTQREINSWDSYNYMTTSSTSYSQTAPMGLFSASASTEKKEATKKFEKEKKVCLSLRQRNSSLQYPCIQNKIFNFNFSFFLSQEKKLLDY